MIMIFFFFFLRIFSWAKSWLVSILFYFHQGELLNNIEKNVTSAAEYVDVSKEEINKAVTYKKNPHKIISLPSFFRPFKRGTSAKTGTDQDPSDWNNDNGPLWAITVSVILNSINTCSVLCGKHFHLVFGAFLNPLEDMLMKLLTELLSRWSVELTWKTDVKKLYKETAAWYYLDCETDKVPSLGFFLTVLVFVEQHLFMQPLGVSLSASRWPCNTNADTFQIRLSQHSSLQFCKHLVLFVWDSLCF